MGEPPPRAVERKNPGSRVACCFREVAKQPWLTWFPAPTRARMAWEPALEHFPAKPIRHRVAKREITAG